MKNHPVGTGLFHADGRTDMTQLMVAFRNFATARLRMLYDEEYYNFGTMEHVIRRLYDRA